MPRLVRFLTFALALATAGCAGTVEHWIVNTRVHQGRLALERGSLHEAELAYRLALRVDPKDPLARAGFSKASIAIADVDYRHSNFEDALATLNAAAKYDPGSVRLQGLRAAIEQAKLKREIVISNYPTYRDAGKDIRKAYAALQDSNKLILKAIERFDYTYDTSDLTSAIEQSYELQLDVAKNTNRLIAYRQLVESGVPQSQQGQGAVSGASASLLPLP